MTWDWPGQPHDPAKYPTVKRAYSLWTFGRETPVSGDALAGWALVDGALKLMQELSAEWVHNIQTYGNVLSTTPPHTKEPTMLKEVCSLCLQEDYENEATDGYSGCCNEPMTIVEEN